MQGRRETQAFRDFVAPPTKTASSVAHSPTIKRIRDATRDTSGLLLEIKDIRDELSILRTIAEYQRKVQLSMRAGSKSFRTVDSEVNEELIAEYNCNDIEELDGLAKRIQDGVLITRSERPSFTLLTFYAKLQITIPLLESEIANRQAEDAADQSKRVMVFTVVTVWFVRRPINLSWGWCCELH